MTKLWRMAALAVSVLVAVPASPLYSVAQTPAPATLADTALLGTVLTYQIGDASACARICSRLEGCSAWTQRPITLPQFNEAPMCTLLTGGVVQRSEPGATSGTNTPAAAPVRTLADPGDPFPTTRPSSRPPPVGPRRNIPTPRVRLPPVTYSGWQTARAPWVRGAYAQGASCPSGKAAVGSGYRVSTPAGAPPQFYRLSAMLVSAPDETLHRANSEFSLPNSGAAESVVVCINAQPGMRWDGMNNAYSGNFAHYFTISGCETGEALLGGGVRGGFPAVSIVADGPVGPPGAQVWRVHQTRSGNTATPHEQVMANSICHRTPSGMSASTRVVTGAAVTVQAEQFATISAACPPGQKALSGGVAHDTAAGPAATGLMRIIASEPEASGDGWTATVLNLNPPGGPAIASSVSTICAPVTP